jgi:hypothetical protein
LRIGVEELRRNVTRHESRSFIKRSSRWQNCEQHCPNLSGTGSFCSSHLGGSPAIARELCLEQVTAVTPYRVEMQPNFSMRFRSNARAQV